MPEDVLESGYLVYLNQETGMSDLFSPDLYETRVLSFDANSIQDVGLSSGCFKNSSIASQQVDDVCCILEQSFRDYMNAGQRRELDFPLSAFKVLSRHFYQADEEQQPRMARLQGILSTKSDQIETVMTGLSEMFLLREKSSWNHSIYKEYFERTVQKVNHSPYAVDLIMAV